MKHELFHSPMQSFGCARNTYQFRITHWNSFCCFFFYVPCGVCGYQQHCVTFHKSQPPSLLRFNWNSCYCCGIHCGHFLACQKNGTLIASDRLSELMVQYLQPHFDLLRPFRLIFPLLHTAGIVFTVSMYDANKWHFVKIIWVSMTYWFVNSYQRFGRVCVLTV